MRNIIRLLGKRSRLLCAASLIAGTGFLMSACGGPDEGPALLEIRNIPINLENLWADVQFFQANDSNWNNPGFTTNFPRSQIRRPTGGFQAQHNLIRIPIPDELRGSTVNVSFRAYDNATDGTHRLAGTTRTPVYIIGAGSTNVVTWGNITRLGAISLNITDIPATIPAFAGGTSLNIPFSSAQAYVVVFRENAFGTSPQPPIIALSRRIDNITSTMPVKIWDNYPSDRVPPYGMADIFASLLSGISISLDERFYLSGRYDIYMIVTSPDGGNILLRWNGLAGAHTVDHDVNNFPFSSFVALPFPTIPASISLDGDNLDPASELARLFFEAVALDRQARGLQ